LSGKKLFCFGYGYSSDYLGHALKEAGGWTVAGTTRDPAKRDALKKRGIDAYIFDYERPLADPLYFMQGTTHLLISTPPGDEGDPAFLIHAQDILRIPTLEWVGYLSTNAVYGDRDGAEVDETASLRPTTKRGSRRLMAEQQWMGLFENHGLPVHIFRLAGIYGPGRSALDSVRAGMARRIHKPGHAFGRIHVEDIAGALMASIQKPHPGRVYNLCDDEPAPSHLVIEYACQLLGRVPPPLVEFDEANLAPVTLSFYMDNRRVKNTRIKEELGFKLKYPNYREGLKACLDAEEYAVTWFRRFDGGGGSEGAGGF
jgi:hypothetical protein